MMKLREKWSEKRTEVEKSNYYPLRYIVGTIIAIVAIILGVVIAFFGVHIIDDWGFWIWLFLLVIAVVMFFIGLIISFKSYNKIFTLKEVTKRNLVGYEYKKLFFADFGEAESYIEATLGLGSLVIKEED